MTGFRLAFAIFLLLPLGCSSGPIKPAPADPTDAAGFVERGDGYAEAGEYEKAAADYREAIRLDPQDGDGYNSLAWLLATCPKDGIRDGKQAVELAKKACELADWKDADYLATLAAAQAECGNFEEAVRWQKKALKLGFEDDEDTEAARAKLKLYQQGKPYRDE
jgi:tetratricopeptide (TPR) repeat protein